MSDLLDLAIAAHGGWERWRQLQRVVAHVSIGGGIWHVKGWPDVFADVRVSIDPHSQRSEYSPFVEQGRRAVFTPNRTEVVADTGEVVEQRDSPRRAFEGHALATRWDAMHLTYFAGYAMWTYLTTPFLFRLPGFHTEEIEPWDENGETWRRLHVTFPPEVHSHCSEQVFYFDETGLLKRHDYSVEIIGGSSSANYATEPKDFGGIVFPTKRRVYATGPDRRPLLERVAVAIDIHDIQVA